MLWCEEAVIRSGMTAPNLAGELKVVAVVS